MSKEDEIHADSVKMLCDRLRFFRNRVGQVADLDLNFVAQFVERMLKNNQALEEACKIWERNSEKAVEDWEENKKLKTENAELNRTVERLIRESRYVTPVTLKDELTTKIHKLEEDVRNTERQLNDQIRDKTRIAQEYEQKIQAHQVVIKELESSLASGVGKDGNSCSHGFVPMTRVDLEDRLDEAARTLNDNLSESAKGFLVEGHKNFWPGITPIKSHLLNIFFERKQLKILTADRGGREYEARLGSTSGWGDTMEDAYQDLKKKLGK